MLGTPRRLGSPPPASLASRNLSLKTLMTLLRSFPLLLAFLFLTTSLQAQVQDTDTELPPRGTNRALSFFFDELSLDDFETGIGGKLWISPTAALRLSLDLGVESTEVVTENEIDRGRSAISFGGSMFIELHRYERGRVSPYIGSGFGVSTEAFSETTDFDLDTGNPIARERFKGSNIAFDVLAGFGVEYRLARRVSLGGEHQFAARVLIGSEDIKRTPFDRTLPSTSTTRETRSFIFDTGASRLILSVYF